MVKFKSKYNSAEFFFFFLSVQTLLPTTAVREELDIEEVRIDQNERGLALRWNQGQSLSDLIAWESDLQAGLKRKAGMGSTGGQMAASE